jgi:CheY-like chemotaxis protein
MQSALKESPNPTVLIVDDDPVLRAAICYQFTNMGCVTLEAANGQEAFDIAIAQPITAIMCDIQMPKMNGLEFLKAIKRFGVEVPVLMMTGFSHFSEAEIAAQGGVVLLNKPFTVAQLNETVEGFIKLL